MSSIKESLREMGRRGLFGGDVDLSENGIGDEIIGLDIPWSFPVALLGSCFANGDMSAR